MKRGESGLSLVVAVNKPSGMSSHDIVNRCRRIFAEKRVGHTGTLDPLATGVLPICIGPATRLDRYMVGHDKRYRVNVVFGSSTTTDDAQGEVVETGSIPSFVRDDEFARDYVSNMVGAHMQTPPQYSAVKVDGKKAYEVARKGGAMELEPRRIEVYAAHLVQVFDDGPNDVSWVIDFHVSKGTYIRSLARDMGENLTCPAYVGALERLHAGRIRLEDAHSLETLESLGANAAIDPIRALGIRFAFADADGCDRAVESGMKLKEERLSLHDPLPMSGDEGTCACTSSVRKSMEAAGDGEIVAVIVANRLKALYRFDAASKCWKPDCVFSVPVYRGL